MPSHNESIEEKRIRYEAKKKAERLQQISKILEGHEYALPAKYSEDQYQSKVIQLQSGHHLVLAGAGCGKTDVLAERIMYAINHGVDTQDMLCLTFTNRAARNMRDRIEIRTGLGDMASLFVGNIHRFCSTFLYEQGVISQTSNILDEIDSESLIKDFMSQIGFVELTENDNGIECNWVTCFKVQHLVYQLRQKHNKEILLNTDSLKPYIKHVADKYPSPRGHWYDYVDLYDNIEQESYSSERIRIFIEECKKAKRERRNIPKPPLDELVKGILKVAKLYEEYKRDNELLDFDDLLLRGYDYLFENNKTIKKYSWIQVDEVQDLNRLQLKIIDLLTDTSRSNVVVYLGDEQQAIYSFMGAKLDIMNYLKDEKCKGESIRLFINYRSPKYLLDVFNHFANYELDTDVSLLPQAHNKEMDDHGGRQFLISNYANEEITNVVAKALELYSETERTAILVPYNKIANDISEKLGKIKHFKISGQDVFSTREVQTLLAHFNVVNFERNFLAWTRLMTNIGVFNTPKASRDFYREMDKCFLTPEDFLKYDGQSYIASFVRDYEGEFVIFDTETTGLDIYNDDIVQIAAVKLNNGLIVDKCNIIIQTDKEIPEFLGDIENPLTKEYAERKQKYEKEGLDKYETEEGIKKYFVNRAEGLKDFLDFAEGCPILGHNVEYDYHILDYNLRRDCNIHNIGELFPTYYDTLKIMRIVEPGLMSYKLKNLLERLHLEGDNSHLADADILATKSVADYARRKSLSVIKEQGKFIDRYSHQINTLVKRYQKYYLHTQEMLYDKQNDLSVPALVSEMEYLYNGLLADGIIEPIEKYQHIKEFLALDALQNDMQSSLHELLNKHIMEINTFKEADLSDSSTIKEKLFVSTVHKAKGLEFENVIVVGVNDGTYPFFPNINKNDKDAIKEDARKLYVAISRAKKRLYISYANRRRGISARGKSYDMEIKKSCFLKHVSIFFGTINIRIEISENIINKFKYGK